MNEPSDGEAMEAWEISNGLVRIEQDPANYYSVFKSVTLFGVNDYLHPAEEWDESAVWLYDGWSDVRPFPRLDATALLVCRAKGNARLMRTGFRTWWKAMRRG